MAYDPSAYEKRRRNLGLNYESQSAINEYARMLGQTRGSRQLGEFERSVTEQIPQYGRAYGKRGLYGQGVKSGIFNKALSMFGSNAARKRAELTEDIAQQGRQFDLTGAGYKTTYETGLSDLELDKARDIGQTAQGLLNLG